MNLPRFEAEGYLLLSSFFRAEELEALNSQFDRLWAKPPANITVDNIDSGERLLLSSCPAEVRNNRYKINDVYLESPTLRRLIARLGPQVDSILGAKGAICNSLHFERGSEQGIHTDLWYMPGARPGQMCAVWIALEDVHPHAGPLVYFPGSHKISPPFDYWTTSPDERIKRTEEAMRHYWQHLGNPQVNDNMKAGDVFFWHEGLIHGGTPIFDKTKTRRSIVVHFWAEEFMKNMSIPITNSMSYFARTHQKPSLSTPAYTQEVK